jgi:Ni/Fe-hydrogenase subunit HybB-like protein
MSAAAVTPIVTTPRPQPAAGASGLVARYFYRAVFALLMVAGAYATYVRAFHGLGAATNLSDAFPWGLWIGFDVLCGVGLAAGGFTLVATVHIFNIETYKPIVRPAILTAFLGYVFVAIALLYDLGQPQRIWHPLIMGNPHSVLFEVAMCVMFYLTVLALEFSPAVFERFGWRAPLKAFRMISVPLVITGVILSTLHQSSLGSLYLIVPHRLHPLWYSPLLPIFFYLSAICVGMAMTIFESWHSSRAFGKHLEFGLLKGLARMLAVLLSTYLVFRMVDLGRRGALHHLLENKIESWMFGLEFSLMLLPALLLFRQHVRNRPGALYACSLMVVLGFVANRLNVALTGVERVAGATYIPKWTEVVVTLAIIAAGFALFKLAAKYLPVFSEGEAH